MDIAYLRSFRVAGIALFDLVLGIALMMLTFWLAQRYHFPNLSLPRFLIAAALLTIPVGIAFHVWFGTDTVINNKLGLSNAPAA